MVTSIVHKLVSRLPRRVDSASLCTHVHDAAEGTDGVWSVYGFCAATGVLHDGAGDHDDVLGGVGQLLDDKVDHLAKTGIFILEELRDAEEEIGGFIRWERLARVQEEGDLCEEDATSSWLDWRAVEKTGCGEGWLWLAIDTKKAHWIWRSKSD